MTFSSRSFEDFLSDLYALSEEMQIRSIGSPSKNPRIEVSDMNFSSRNFEDIPSDLLHLISEKLNVIELLSFRGVCKNWRSASCTSSMFIDRSPWFLLRRRNSAAFVLLTAVEGDLYGAVIPELKDSDCIASGFGWILVRKTSSNSLFFFYPFSRVRIDLPKIPIDNETEFAGAFSCPPTSEHCVVCVASNNPKGKLELHVIRRGQTDWTLFKGPDVSGENITSMVYFFDRVHLFEGSDKFREFSFGDKRWKRYQMVSVSESNRTVPMMPYFVSMVNSRNWFNSKNRGTLSSLHSLSTCGTFMDGKCFLGEKEQVAERESNQLRGVWIEPRFFEISGTPDW